MVNIRRASCEDGLVVSQLLKEKYSFENIDEAGQAFNMECAYQHFRLAEEQGRPVGIISWRPQGALKHGVVELTRLAVMPSAADKQLVKEMLFDVLVAEADFFIGSTAADCARFFP